MLLPLPIQLIVEDSLPGAEVQLAFGNGYNYLASHDRPLQVCISIVLKPIVLILAVGFLWCKLLKPDFIILMQP